MTAARARQGLRLLGERVLHTRLARSVGHHWPLLALLAVAAIVLGGVALLGRDAGDTTTAPSAPASATPSASPRTSPSASPRTSASSSAAAPTPRTVDVDAGDYVGSQVDTVVARLTGLGLDVRREPRQTGSVAEGTVVDVQPTGRLAPGTAVTVVFATTPPTPTPTPTLTPTPTPTSAPPSPSASPSETNEGEPDEDEPDEDENGNRGGNGGRNGGGNGRGNG